MRIDVVVLSQVRTTADLLAERLSRDSGLNVLARHYEIATFARWQGSNNVVLVYDCAPGGAVAALFALEERLRLCKLVPVGLQISPEDVRTCAQLGATTFVGFDAATEDIIAAITAADCGDFWISAGLAHHTRLDSLDDARRYLLTDRERQVAALRTRGWSYSRIATSLNVSTFTVKNHLHNIYRKGRHDDDTGTHFPVSGREV